MASSPPATPASSKFARVCVYCGSSTGNRPDFVDAAAQLGSELVRRGIGLVYGGGSVGLMGEVSGAVHRHGGKVLGVIPIALQPVEVSGESVGEVRVVSDMHERKAMMAGSLMKLLLHSPPDTVCPRIHDLPFGCLTHL